MGNFKFGEHSTKDFDLIIQTPPTYNIPEKDVTIEHIPGRNGDLVIDNESWQNVERTYSVASVFRPGTDFIGNAERLIAFLTKSKGYQRLEDSYDPNVYRLAEYRSSGSLVNYYDKATAINITFTCKPQRYLKNGEKVITFNSSEAILENPTDKPALPEIAIDSILPADNEVLLVTTKNLDSNKVNSIITLKKIPTATTGYDVNINSELQTVYSIQNGDINSSVNMNSTNFPVLYAGRTSISIKNYIENSYKIEQYSSLINRNVVGSNVVLAKYKPFNSSVESKQQSLYVMSYDLLKQKLGEVYEMPAYLNYCLEKAETYTYDSFNTLLQNNKQTFTFQGDYSGYPDWLEIETDEETGDLLIKVGRLNDLDYYDSRYGYFITTNAGSDFDKRIIRGIHGTVIARNPNLSKTITITFYPAYTTTEYSAGKTYEVGDQIAHAYGDYVAVYEFVKHKEGNISWDDLQSYIKRIPWIKSGDLKVDYRYLGEPSWVQFRINYTNDDNYSPDSIEYIRPHSVNGYYYLPKSGFLTSATWKFYSSNVNVVLNSLSWNNWKKAFMPNDITTSTTISYTYYYLPYPYKTHVDPDTEETVVDEEYLQYENIYENELNEDGSIKKDANGNPVRKLSNEVHFIVVPSADSKSAIASITLYAKDQGYFRFNDEAQNIGWISKPNGNPLDPGDQIQGSGSTLSIKSTNIVYYLKEIPNYSTIDKWPTELIDPDPIQRDNTGEIIQNKIINPSYIDFTVRRDGWYRYSYETSDGTIINTDWVYRQSGSVLGILNPGTDILYPSNSSGYSEYRPTSLSTTIYFLDSEEPVFPIKEYKYTDVNGNSIKNIGLFTIDQEGKEHEICANPDDQRYDELPNWLRIDVKVGEKEDYSDYVLYFYPMVTGLYKWDTKTVWNIKNAVNPEELDNKELVSSLGTDDTSIYFLENLPEYPTSGTIYDLCSVEINSNVETGNPESITIYAKVEGYYRSKNNSSWKYFNVNDEICNSKINEDTNIYYLSESENDLDNITISVIPRWWSL